ncbi:MAG: NAD(P)/FAD-dependent oxidoreductase [Gemmatimonadetes bacterium]|nr:NAD(P)/FAD-dependent oxidoreductase [Gemmatimonadota bacterium]
METCEVLIVGGGPGGSSCAAYLADHGIDVLIVDRARFPRTKLCAGWVTPAVFHALGIDPDHYSERHTLQPIHGFRIAIMGRRPRQVDYGHPVSYGIVRSEFDTDLLERSGARVRSGEPVQSIERARSGWVVNGTIHANVIVGAGGHFCPVARALGAKPGRGEHAVYARENEYSMNEEEARACELQGTIPELHFSPDLKGYGWCFRKDRYLNYGLGHEVSANLPRRTTAFFERYRASGRIPDTIPARFHGHAYLLYGSGERPFVSDRALLVGDAAGLAYPQSGEGIRTAVESGLLAGRAIAAARGRGDGNSYSAERLAPYATELRRRFGAPHGANYWLKRLPQSLLPGIAGKLLTTPWFAREILIGRWFLARHEDASIERGGTQH